LNFYKNFCKEVFGTGIFPDGSFNKKFGGADIVATNIFFGNGCEDPWRQDSLLKSSGSLTLYTVECDDCGHCVGMSDPTVISMVTDKFS